MVTACFIANSIAVKRQFGLLATTLYGQRIQHYAARRSRAWKPSIAGSRPTLPHPDSVPTLEKLRRFEPQAMRGQPPLVWDRAEDIFVYDKYGNRWLDWSSGVLVTNAGHGAPEVRQAIIDQVNSGLLHNYVFPSEERAALVEQLVKLAPKGLEKVFLLTTGSEATECAIKLARSHGIRKGGTQKIGIVGAERGFHGRTLGRPASRRDAGTERLDRQRGPRHCAGPFPRRLLDRGHELRVVPGDAGQEGIAAGECRGGDVRDVSGRGAGLRAGGLHSAAREMVQRAGRLAGVRRSPGRVRAHGQVLGVRALWGHAGFDLLRQRHQQFAAALGGHWPRGDHGPVWAGLDVQHAHGQPGLLRRGPGQFEEDHRPRT